MRRPKVFGIGLSKTGTTSLNQALEILGYDAKHFPTKWKHFEMYDAATDSSVADIFETLDVRFPGSKFIYTVRNLDSWLRSCERFWQSNEASVQSSPVTRDVNTRLYGSLKFDRELFAQAHAGHEKRVLTYFADRPRDLLTLDFSAGGGSWEPLCAFLEVPVPQESFPHGNESTLIKVLALQLLQVVGDSEQVAKITRLSKHYIESLREQSSGDSSGGMDSLLELGENTKVAAILARSCRHFGNVDALAQKLSLPRDFVKNSLASRQRRLWAKRLKKLKLELRWLGRKVYQPSTQISPYGT